MEPLARLDSKSILSEEIFLEIFDQEDEITKARMILSLTDRAGELGVKKKFEELLKAYRRVDKEAKQRERKKPITMLDKWTNFEGPYNNMFCGAWIAGEDGVYAQNDSQVDAVACYHPILPVERMKNLETGEEQIKIRLMMRADGNISMTMQLLRCHHSMANSCSVSKIKKKEIQE